MSTIKQDHGVGTWVTTSATTYVVASILPAANKSFFLTDLSVSSSNATGSFFVHDGLRTIWAGQLGLNPYEHSFVLPLACPTGGSCTVYVSGTPFVTASIAGFHINNT